MNQEGESQERPGNRDELLKEDAEDLYENAPCGYLSMRPDGTIVRVNGTFLAWTGYSRDELVGIKRFQELLTPGGRIFHETHYAPLLRMQGAVREIAVDVVCSNGRRLPALVNSVVKNDRNGKPVLVRTTIFDATERREYERELLRARRRAEISEQRAQALARTLQASFMPPATPTIPGLEVGASYRAAVHGDEVGGDFYDVFELADGWAVAMGDVCGKGVKAAAVTVLARHTIRAAAIRSPRPRPVLGTLNEVLLRQESERFCTGVYAWIRTETMSSVSINVASAGHPLPILISHGREPAFLGRPGTVLGVVEDPDIDETSLSLHADDVVVFFTDGVPEGRIGSEFYGEERLTALLETCRGGQALAIAERIVEDVVEFQEGVPRDDIAVVVLKVPASAA